MGGERQGPRMILAFLFNTSSDNLSGLGEMASLQHTYYGFCDLHDLTQPYTFLPIVLGNLLARRFNSDIVAPWQKKK